MNIFFRVDSSIAIGTGHLMRCLTLADKMLSYGANVSFISRNHNGNLNTLVKDEGFKLFELPLKTSNYMTDGSDYSGWLGASWQDDASQVRVVLAKQKVDILFVDHYAIGAQWEMQVRQECSQLVVIDDLANRTHSCDVLIDQTYGRCFHEYASHVDEDCLLLLGSAYSILRPEFAKLRSYSLLRRPPETYTQVLVSLGGVDKDNVTADILMALTFCQLPVNFVVTVVVGSNAPHKDALTDLAGGLPYSVKVLTGVNNMAEIMAESDLAIGAAGCSAWERCCLGLPTIMLAIADNQLTIAKNLFKSGGAILLERPIKDNLVKLFSGSINSQLNKVSINSSLLVDGLGVSRIAEKVASA